MCLEEALANLILHAKARGAEKGIRVSVSAAPGEATIVVRDRCEPFDITDERLMPARDGERVGGNGIRLMRSLSATLRYDIGQDCNALSMRFSAAAASAPESDAAAIRSIPVFADLPEEALSALTRSAPIVFADGDILLEQGAASEHALILLSGAAAIFNQSQHGEAPLAQIAAPALIGEIGALTGARRTAGARAVGDVRALKLERGALLEAGEHAPDLLVSVIRRLGQQIETINGALGLYAAGFSALERDDFEPSVLEQLNNPTEELRAFSVAFRGLARKVIHERRARGEMASATLIQSSMLPPPMDPALLAGRCDVFGAMHPARHVAGDLFDHFFVDDDKLAIVIGDVCGKGVPAALFMCVTVTALRIAAQTHDDLSRVIARANDTICAQNAMSMFATLFYGVLDLKSRTLDYVNCGHNPPYLLHGNGTCEELPGRAPPLGLFAGRSWPVHRAQLQAGEGVFLFSDGVTESIDSAGADYGDARLAALLSSREKKRASALVETVVAGVNAFAGDEEQFDDITCLAALLP